MASKKPPKFSVLDKPWVAERCAVYSRGGFVFPDGKDSVAKIVAAFEAEFGRPPKWRTPFDEQRMLAVDKTNVVLRKLEGSYADLLDELSRKSFGGLSITDVREDRGTDERKVILEFKIGKTTHTLKMRAMKDGGIDPAIISEVNKLMVGKRRFVVATLDEPRILIVAIDKKFENILRMDGIKFITAGELKKLV